MHSAHVRVVRPVGPYQSIRERKMVDGVGGATGSITEKLDWVCFSQEIQPVHNHSLFSILNQPRKGRSKQVNPMLFVIKRRFDELKRAG